MDILKLLFGPPLPSLSVEDAQARLKGRPAPFLLDVRQPGEYQTGHIAGAALIPLNELGVRLRELPKGREILCVCQSGNRSSTATRQLLKAGYTAVNVRGGMHAWQSARLPVKKGAAR